MAFYRNKNWTKRDYETTNIVAAESKTPPAIDWHGRPADFWEPAAGEPGRRLFPAGIIHLFTVADVKFWGYP